MMKSLMLITIVSLGIMMLIANMTVAAVVKVLASKYVEEKYTTAIDCEEASPSDDFLCNGINGVEGLPYCDKYDEKSRAKIFPELRGCWNREYSH